MTRITGILGRVKEEKSVSCFFEGGVSFVVNLHEVGGRK